MVKTYLSNFSFVFGKTNIYNHIHTKYYKHIIIHIHLNQKSSNVSTRTLKKTAWIVGFRDAKKQQQQTNKNISKKKKLKRPMKRISNTIKPDSGTVNKLHNAFKVHDVTALKSALLTSQPKKKKNPRDAKMGLTL
jgi:hypothetical protein